MYVRCRSQEVCVITFKLRASVIRTGFRTGPNKVSWISFIWPLLNMSVSVVSYRILVVVAACKNARYPCHLLLASHCWIDDWHMPMHGWVGKIKLVFSV